MSHFSQQKLYVYHIDFDHFPGKTTWISYGPGERRETRCEPAAALLADARSALRYAFLFSKDGTNMDQLMIPSGKLSHNYGKPPFLMGKSTINGNFQQLLYVSLPEGTDNVLNCTYGRPKTSIIVRVPE